MQLYKFRREFGPIFNELLPNSFAKLQPLEGKLLTDGLEVKVCLGGVQKKSLTELSGGQRYLHNICLIYCSFLGTIIIKLLVTDLLLIILL